MQHVVIASEFATDEDLRAYQKAKAEGKSDEEAFAVGDNCIGCWGDRTNGTIPMCALPPETMVETWGSVANAKHQHILVSYKTSNCVCLVADRMPHLTDITNGAGVDLNPAAVQVIGLPYGAMEQVTWDRVEPATPV